nr:uncharacterized protein LOC100184609 isoform X1 [Ciona intestinalis]|eukprot:XP_002129521.1 uncharacterized protein LOC100184609 isoform X1 [Ciona intestinalis]
MFSLYFVVVLLINYLVLVTSKTETTCNVIGIGNSFYSLSNDKVTGNTASTRCYSVGGSLATLGSQPTIQRLESLMGQTYVSKLQRTWLFYNSTDIQFYKYAQTPNQPWPWKLATRPGDVTYIDLYTEPVGLFEDKIYFCKYPNLNPIAWQAYNVPCTNGWFDDFILYGSYKRILGSKTYFIFSNPESWSVRLTNVKKSDFLFPIYVDAMYGPETQVFLGAKSLNNVSGWTWPKQGNNYNILLPVKPECQRLAWYYGLNGWSPRAVDCNTTSAYYACQIQVDIFAQVIDCSSVNVSWSPTNTYRKINQITVALYNSRRSYSRTTRFDALNVIFVNVAKDGTNYTIKATVSWPNCPSVIYAVSEIRLTPENQKLLQAPCPTDPISVSKEILLGLLVVAIVLFIVALVIAIVKRTQESKSSHSEGNNNQRIMNDFYLDPIPHVNGNGSVQHTTTYRASVYEVMKPSDKGILNVEENLYERVAENLV